MTTESTTPQWVKSSYSGNGGTCVEWAPRTAILTGTVPVRDSKTPDGPALALTADAFTAFVASVKTGDFTPAA
ncbi:MULTISPECIES: DUF397 domain-containing protein [Streptomyces]|uniref:DUF397 domain-containing protein n=1 Tax=Streptomyces TaxID=1883 RepID=UPI0004BD4684|nr:MULTISPECIES: DUF397 domain-containing protein [Streptomyces]MYW77213.1 DUF397 domain-containing protein [Streptomyces sp. SID8369]NEA10148.1 DUF397 domain-containing protein [Streptomyces sp. SID10692]NEC40760.1 DUF397 domain-containing protein [Streptomyces sp. SID8016]KOG77385.1 hypothetical protein ADK33_31140 [Streptomyces griseus subsp. rhodochrous]MBD3548360.1 DUF397 domain-containing protein [Streptomyces sp. JV180]